MKQGAGATYVVFGSITLRRYPFIRQSESVKFIYKLMVYFILPFIMSYVGNFK